MRIGALEFILNNDGQIIFAVKSIKWPGEASLNVAILSIKKGKIENEKIILEENDVSYISSFLSSDIQLGEPFALSINRNQAFTGYYFLGDGFILTTEDALNLINSNKKNQEVVFPLLNGDDFNDSPTQKSSRYIINFFDWPLSKESDIVIKNSENKPFANEYPEVLRIVEELVKPDRYRWKKDKSGNEIIGEYQLDKTYRDKWWQFARSRPEMRKAIENKEKYLVTAQTTKYQNFVMLDKQNAVSQTCYVIALDKYYQFLILQSNLHFSWALKFGNSLGDTFRYSPEKAFETFPFPTNISDKLEHIGEIYHEHRKQLMLKMQLGLTKTFNLFHIKELSYIEIQKACKQEESICKKAFDDILKLRELHKQMDESVLEAYGWGDIQLKHDFYEVDYLPENDRVRYTIHPDARKEVLKRLLDLNHTIYEEEIKQGLHKKEDVAKFYEQKGVPVPAEVSAIMGVAKKEKTLRLAQGKNKTSKKSTVNESESIYKQPGLFEEDNLFSVGDKD
jgi:hypothetical protein